MGQELEIAKFCIYEKHLHETKFHLLPREHVIGITSCCLHQLWEEGYIDLEKFWEGKNDCFWCAMEDLLQQLVKSSMCIDSVDGYFRGDFLDIFKEIVEVTPSLTTWDVYNKGFKDDAEG